eukprot:CAMPEP_0202687772 /NCGR_PEP_ID=MMETSP1385-20130828/3392_1 /ASSEMBLY_ACC=CAM_ASM_000861 /TAXON_ID=933848 /ORGANISM="Elphidium margaritaceum" /LENGTH=137 /DNA_ID=CAMNT_0049342615 /DNA_START=52 /DNA_END=465 /DNA_ORIENTATION=+
MTSSPTTWRELRDWDRMEEDEIRRFEAMRERKTASQIAWDKFSKNPIPYILAPCVGYCIFAGLNALQTGHAYMAIKYLEYRIWTQGTAIASLFIGGVYYQRKERRDLFKLQPYGPYRKQYGKSHIGYTSDKRYGFNW